MNRKLFYALGVSFSVVMGSSALANDNQWPAPLQDQDFHDNGSPPQKKVELGKLLFFDKILSGNKNTSCATCHHPLTDTGDGLSLPVGEGGRGLGMIRSTGEGGDAIHERVPRNAPPVFNLGAKEFAVLMHDGRMAVDASQPSGFLSPEGDGLPPGLDSIFAVQAMFPVTSAAEMAGQPGENSIADAVAADDISGPEGVWAQLAWRLQEIPEYVDLFSEVYDDVHAAEDISYVHAANAIAAFEAVTWRADNSPFDRFLRGERSALSKSAKKGARLFYGKLGCGECHQGVLQTDHGFHAIAMPQIGPGKGDGADGREDFGRERVTLDSQHRYQFRTPSLRNVALTGPWGHAGAYNSLEAVVRHHFDAENALYAYDTTQAALPSRADLDEVDFVVQNDSNRLAEIAARNELPPQHVSEKQFKQLMDFLNALTDPSSLDLRTDIPKRVPSGLPVAE